MHFMLEFLHDLKSQRKNPAIAEQHFMLLSAIGSQVKLIIKPVNLLFGKGPRSVNFLDQWIFREQIDKNDERSVVTSY